MNMVSLARHAKLSDNEIRASNGYLKTKMADEFDSIIRSRLAEVLRAGSLFGSLDEDVLYSLEKELDLISLTSGEVLFRQGDPGDSLYIVISGRLIVSVSADRQARRLIAQLGPGEIVGEMALLNGEPRSATISAARDTQLARLTNDGLSRLTTKYPQAIFSAFVRQLSTRLGSMLAGAQKADALPACFAVVPLSSEVPAERFCPRLARELSGGSGTILHLSSERLDDILGIPGAAQAMPGDRGHAPLANWLTEREASGSKLLYQTDRNDSPWTARCLRQADLILLLASHDDDVHKARSQANALCGSQNVEKRKVLVLLREEKDGEPAGTAVWTQNIQADRHFHIRLDLDRDFARLSRFLTGRSVGLALGGGFARGLGHVGVIRAMHELGIPIDMVGGTSMGAIIAGQCAVEWDTASMLEISSQRAAASLKGDYTLPFVSLLTGRKFSKTIMSIARGRDIEDTLIPFFCVSASLTRCEMKVHSSGDAAKSIIASARAPGMFPPLSWNDELLVDGGLVNMVPASVVRERLGGGTVISVDVSPRTEFEKVDFGLHFSGWRALWRMLNPFSAADRSVGIIDILMRTLEFGRAPYASPEAHADAHLILPLGQFSHRDFNRSEEMAEIGYQFAKKYFANWMKEFGRPWENSASSS